MEGIVKMSNRKILRRILIFSYRIRVMKLKRKVNFLKGRELFIRKNNF